MRSNHGTSRYWHVISPGKVSGEKGAPGEMAPGTLLLASGPWLHPTATRQLRLVQTHLVTMTHSDHLLPSGTSLGQPRQWADRGL